VNNSAQYTYLSSRHRFLALSALILLVVGASPAVATTSRIIVRSGISPAQRQKLTTQLSVISGLTQLAFDEMGGLQPGEVETLAGSSTARSLLRKAASGENVIVIEDASARDDVVFCRIIPARWVNGSAGKPPAYVLLIDFSDFDRLLGDRLSLESFNVGWAVLHELVHVVYDSADAEEYGDIGDCEALVNVMRREVGLPIRGEYFFTFVPGQENSAFQTRLVRLAFEESTSSNGKKKRYWLVWDANLVGGLPNRQIAFKSSTH
jgi:hypothetical protein